MDRMRAKLLLLLVLVLAASGAAFAGQQPRRWQRNPWLLKNVEVTRDIEYDRAGDTPLLLDLYVPPKKPDGPLPIVVWIHGGGWRGGDKRRCRALLLVKRGYAVASVNYRLSREATFPAQIHDCKSAIRWIRANAKKYSIDPDRIGVWGGSAGGHLVALLGTSGGVKALEGDGANLDQSSRVQAVADFCGPADLTAFKGADRSRRLLEAFLGGPVDDNLAKAALASPVTHITKDDPPFLIMHGSADPVVPAAQSRRLPTALKKAGIDTTLRIIEGAGHGVSGPGVHNQVTAFFDKHLNPKTEQAPDAPEE